MSLKVVPNVTDYDPGAFTPQGAVGLGTTVAAGDITGTHGVPLVSGIGGIAVTGTPAAGKAIVASSGAAIGWAAVLTDPMTTRGDLIDRNASNVTARLAIGAAGKILSSDGTDVSWGNGPMTTQDDLIYGGASGTPTRLGKGTDGQVLTVDPSTHHLLWATPSSGFSNPMTTKGDIIVGDTGGSPIRKAVGSDTQVLTADSASTGGIKWAAGGGGGSSDAILGQSGVGGARISGLQGSPDKDVAGTNDDEFNTTTGSGSTPPGWTITANTPTTLDVNTTALGHLYIKAPTPGANDKFYGLYKAAPSIPYTMTAQISGHDLAEGANNAGVCMAVSDSSTLNGKTVMIEVYSGTPGIASASYTALVPGGGGNATGGAGLNGPTARRFAYPFYLRAIVHAANNIDLQISRSGYIWEPLTTGTAYLAAATYVFIGVNTDGQIVNAVFDWVRFT